MSGTSSLWAARQDHWYNEADMKNHPHCYHIDFAHETETCCWCSDERRLKFGQGQFDRDVGMTTPLLSTWWWRYNPKMVDLCQQVISRSGKSKAAHGPHGIHDGPSIEYADEEQCSGVSPDPWA